MLVELRVRDLGVIEDTTLEFGPGMTAVTGETGTGKTLVVEALELLVGGRADPVLVRQGAKRALVEGRFVTDAHPGVGGIGDGDSEDEDTEIVLARMLPATGRSRAWVNGMMSTVSALAGAGAQLVDLHGQHSHQSLLDPASQRGALDTFAGIDLAPLNQARMLVRKISAEIERLGGDEKERAREADLLRYQVDEIMTAGISGANEDDVLRVEESKLSGATQLREAASLALTALDSEELDGSVSTRSANRTGSTPGTGVLDGIGAAVAQLDGHEPLEELRTRALGLQAETADLATDLRRVIETWEDDPKRLANVSSRRAKLADLRRKYGDTLEEVIAYRDDAQARLLEVETTEERASALGGELAAARAQLADVQAQVAEARRSAAPLLASAVQTHLRTLAMPAARIEVEVGDDPSGDEVTFLLGANPGEPALPLSKVASGGELARTMLALRLVVSGGRPTLVFDEVDAGIGGAAANTVGRALAALAENGQVLVVTHLPQVAAFAEQHVVVEKQVKHGRTIATVRPVDGPDRVAELARMLSGRPGSSSARQHAEELLHESAGIRVAPGTVD